MIRQVRRLRDNDIVTCKSKELKAVTFRPCYFDNNVLSSVQHLDQVNTLINKFLVFGNLTFSLTF